jgi:hypothetical protein
MTAGPRSSRGARRIGNPPAGSIWLGVAFVDLNEYKPLAISTVAGGRFPGQPLVGLAALCGQGSRQYAARPPDR